MTIQPASQSIVNSSFVIQIAGDGNTASIAVNINTLDSVPASVQAAVDVARLVESYLGFVHLAWISILLNHCF